MSGVTQNHYETLGLDRRCTVAQIRNAYRVRVKQHHPDLHPQAEQAMGRAQELNAAYEVLSDAAQRDAYDRALDRADSSARRAAGGRLERDVAQDIHLRMEEFFRGTSLIVRVNDPGNPTGAETYELEVPEMTAPGARFRIPRTAPFDRGFVQIRLRALPGSRFKIRASDLRCDARISAQLAASGGTESISGATGRALRVTIPKNVRRGEIVRVPGEGMPKPRGGRGDLLVRITYRPEVRVTRTR